MVEKVSQKVYGMGVEWVNFCWFFGKNVVKVRTFF